MIDFLSTRDFSHRGILEWGSGHSTLWWAQRAKSVVSYETDPDWYKWLASRVPETVDLRLVSPDPAEFRATELEGTTYAVILIDGGIDRLARLHASLPHLAESGGVLVDNTNEPKHHRMVTDLKALGFSQVDFHGYIPCAVKRGTTSLFFKDQCFLLE